MAACVSGVGRDQPTKLSIRLPASATALLRGPACTTRNG